jgi:hypothetical protein
MRTHLILVLVLGLTQAACQDNAGPSPGPSQDSPDPPASPPTLGTLVVSTASGGNDPDQDGYLLTIDGVDSVTLDVTDTSRIDLPAGPHALRLVGMAEHCSVSPGTPLDVPVPSGDTTSVAFEVMCSLTGVRITTKMTGLDFDTDGYHVEVDGTDRGIVFSNDTVLTRLDPGSRTIGLTGLTSNCTVDGPGSRTVTIVEAEIAPVEFAMRCTATSGVIKVIVTGAIPGAMYQATLDGANPTQVGTGGLAYLDGISAGDHLVSLSVPANCSVRPRQQSVRVTAGSLVRDTVEASFSVTACTGSGTIRVEVLSSFYSLMGFTPVQLTLDGKVHDLQVRDGQTVTLIFGDLSLGMHSLEAQFTYNMREWVRCHSRESLHALTQPVSIIGSDTVEVEVEIWSSVHCHFR